MGKVRGLLEPLFVFRIAAFAQFGKVRVMLQELFGYLVRRKPLTIAPTEVAAGCVSGCMWLS